MVKEINGAYACEECSFEYDDKEWAEKCETWCKEHKSCNIDITKHSLKANRKSSGLNFQEKIQKGGK